jgi:hypothetical protein
MPGILELPLRVHAAPNDKVQRGDDSDPCGWMCPKAGCFGNCTRHRSHPGKHFCDAGHSY